MSRPWHTAKAGTFAHDGRGSFLLFLADGGTAFYHSADRRAYFERTLCDTEFTIELAGQHDAGAGEGDRHRLLRVRASAEQPLPARAWLVRAVRLPVVQAHDPAAFREGRPTMTSSPYRAVAARDDACESDDVGRRWGVTRWRKAAGSALRIFVDLREPYLYYRLCRQHIRDLRRWQERRESVPGLPCPPPPPIPVEE